MTQKGANFALYQKNTPASTETVYLVLGSNISPRENYIRTSVELLRDQFPDSFLTSSLYITQPYNSEPQSPYLNQAVKFVTERSCSDILRIVQEIEKKIGRKRGTNRFESRVIDIDIIFFGTRRVNRSDLTIPHYDMRNRDFFIVPILELDKFLLDPISGKTLSWILDQIPIAKRTNPQKLHDPIQEK